MSLKKFTMEIPDQLTIFNLSARYLLMTFTTFLNKKVPILSLINEYL